MLLKNTNWSLKGLSPLETRVPLLYRRKRENKYTRIDLVRLSVIRGIKVRGAFNNFEMLSGKEIDSYFEITISCKKLKKWAKPNYLWPLLRR